MDENKQTSQPTDQPDISTDPTTTTEAKTNTSSEVEIAAPISNSESQKIHHRIFGDQKILLVVLVAIILLSAGGVLAWKHFSKKPKTTANQTAISSSQKQKTTSSNTPKATVVSLDGSTYLDTPKNLGDLSFFTSTAFLGTECTGSETTCTTPIAPSELKYFQVGTTKSGQQIIIFESPRVSLDSNVFYALGSTDGKYQILTSMGGFSPDGAKYLSPNVSLDDKTSLAAIDFPQEVTVSNQKLKRTYDNTNLSYDTFLTDGINSIRGDSIGGAAKSVTKVGETGGLSYYEVVLDDKTTFKVVEMYAVYKNLFSYAYMPNGEIASLKGQKIPIKWTTGENTLSEYFSAGRGCGISSGYLVATNLTSSDLAAVGKTPQGQAVYELPTANALAQKIFAEDYNAGQNLDNKANQNLSIDQFTAKHAYILIQNGLGEYVLFESTDLMPLVGGCAKPAVYLYPTSTTKVNVKVNAEIVKSDPKYGQNGWQNVTASPDGTIKSNGKTYPYLFWDGFGNGRYPVINQGVIVGKSEAVATIESQLTQQGLSAKEIKDFVNYWQPVIQTVPHNYIRLTWLNTQAMNQLAALNVSPKPQTVLRVFLQFEGLDKPYAIQSQNFNAPTRTGFTLVEWGGYYQKFSSL